MSIGNVIKGALGGLAGGGIFGAIAGGAMGAFGSGGGGGGGSVEDVAAFAQATEENAAKKNMLTNAKAAEQKAEVNKANKAGEVADAALR